MGKKFHGEYSGLATFKRLAYLMLGSSFPLFSLQADINIYICSDANLTLFLFPPDLKFYC